VFEAEETEKASMIAEMPAKDPSSAVVQLMEWIDPAIVGKKLNGIITQKLIRTLCPDCRQAYRPNAQFLKKAGLPADLKVLYRKPKPDEEAEVEPEPCEKCNDIGYYGQTAMLELLEMTPAMRALVATKPEASAIRALVREEKMITLQADALRLVAEGKTSFEEIQRVFKA
jgi:type II secretory ATPase GspE/PulE/Tfp pilus assembly ATPase PilB-like protein